MPLENTDGKILLYGNVEENDNRKTWNGNVAILFDYITDEKSSVEADITDNWVESNYSIQDHIAIKPRIYRLKGCVGEVLYEDVYKIFDIIDSAQKNHPVLAKTLDVANSVASISSVVSNYTNAAINVAKQLESSYDRYFKLWNTFKNGENEFVGKRQKAVYGILQTLLENRKPVKIADLAFDFSILPNQTEKIYYIQSVSARQGDNAFISDIEVTLKEFRIATTKTTKVDTKQFAKPTAVQKAAEANTGNAKGDTIPKKVTNDWTKSVSKSLKKVDTITAAKPNPIRNPIQFFSQKLTEIQYNTNQYNQQLKNTKKAIN